ncbi:FAD-dependent thymidylate synthase [Synergistaceae bacterium OttesenSCG-928-I11]|nr:FAD-dependent thymidylate synthase [Synergistaceae bacterium OttesenSCG-928-I11]
MSCEVKLIAATADATRVVAAAAKLCYSASRASDLYDGLDADKVKNFLRQLRSVGHMSPFEHASFTFAIDGLSRVASHQLVRHRIASFSQQSQRYVTMGAPCAVVPDEIAKNPEATALFERAANESHAAYERLVAMGVPKEDARFILPHGWETSLVMTMNARELNHFFALRLCRRAQWEIRCLARKMLALVRESSPELFDPTGPSCVAEGRCREAHPCGQPYESVEALLVSDD